MRKRLIPALLCLCLLAGCENYPEPKGDRAEFDAFVAGVNAARATNMEWTQEEKERFETYTPDISNQVDALTQAELDAIVVPREEKSVSREEALADIDLFFRLLKSAYGGYDVHGGDEVFLAARDKVLRHFTEDREYTAAELKKHLDNALAPFARDGHLQLGGEAVWKETQYMYYVPDLYFTDTTGLDMDYVKPTIGPDGALTYCFAALSEGRSRLPQQIGTMENLNWLRAECPRNLETVAYRRTTKRGITVMESRTMNTVPQWEDQLREMAEAGASYQDLPCFMIDIRSNGGGGETPGGKWIEGFTGQSLCVKTASAWKFSTAVEKWMDSEDFKQHGGESIRSLLPQGDAGTWQISQSDGERAGSDSLIFVLTDGNIGSAAEGFLYGLRTVDQVVTVGSNTAGCTTFGNRMTFYLPHSGIAAGLAPIFGFRETAENIEGVGILPDLWVNPADAQDAVLRLIDYYGLR